MKPALFLFEFGGLSWKANDYLWKPFYFKGRMKNGYFRRFGWLCFSISLVYMDLFEYNRHVASGATEWKDI